MFMLKESAVDFTEIEEALILVKERRTNKSLADDQFTSKVDSEKIKSKKREIFC